MYNTVISALAGLAVVGALLAAGAFSSAGTQPAGGPTPVTAESVEQTVRKTCEEATDQPRKRTRARASLSMPYFSFAQSLRTRG